MDEKEFKVNEHIILRLENDITNIYVNGEFFQQCKSLLFIDPHLNDKLRQIHSMDDAIDLIDKTLNSKNKEFELDGESEFWGHCSNLQAWVEHNYDINILDSRISIPLLKEMYKSGDSIAGKVYKDEIIKSFLSDNMNRIIMIISEGYLKIFNTEELNLLLEEFNYKRFMKNTKIKLKVRLECLQMLTQTGYDKTVIYYKNFIIKNFKKGKDLEVLFNHDHLGCLDRQELFTILSELKKKDLLNKIELEDMEKN